MSNKLAKSVVPALALALLALALLLLFGPALIERDQNKVASDRPLQLTPRARQLHDALFVIDLHSDALLWQRDLSQRSSLGHVDLPRLRDGGVALQVFSATTKSPRGQNYERNSGSSDNITALALVQRWPLATWQSLYARAEYQLQRLQALAADEDNQLILVRTRADMQRLIDARASGTPLIGAMYLIEGAHPLESDLENLDRLHEQGLQFVGLTHFFDNAVAGSLHGVSGAGLTDFGREVVARADDLQMTIDVAHLSPAGVREVLALARRPVILSHGGFKGLCDTPRNLDDALMVELAEHGAIIGVGFWDGAVCDASPQGIVASIRYGIDLLGLEHIALGSDFDGTVTTPFDVAGMAQLTQAMLDAKFSEAEIRAVMGGNMQRFLLQQLPD